MKHLNILWGLAIAFDVGALMVVLTNQYAAAMSTFIIWAVLIMMAVILTLCTMQVRMMEPKKKKLPVRRGSRLVATSRRGKLKVVEK